MQLKALTAVLITAVFAAGFGSVGHAKALSQTSTTNSQTTVKVAAGDTLSTIGREHHTTYIRLYDANPGISDPNLIFPGENIRIPSADEKLPDRLKPVSHTAPIPPAVSRVSQPQTPVVSAPVQTSASGVWNELAQCESGGNWAADTGNGFYGGLQFTLSSWHAAGGSGYPNQASASEQIARAEILRARQGWGAWPACSAKLGL